MRPSSKHRSGSTVGLADGLADGLAVGLADGLADGLAVGADGLTVGDKLAHVDNPSLTFNAESALS